MGRPRILAAHGTARRARQHRALDEIVCPPCKNAISRAQRNYYSRRRGYTTPERTTTMTTSAATIESLDELCEPGTLHSDPLISTTRGNTCMGDQTTGKALCGASGGRAPTPEERAATTAVCRACRRALYRGNVGRTQMMTVGFGRGGGTVTASTRSR